jgi:hypothetical protein
MKIQNTIPNGDASEAPPVLAAIGAAADAASGCVCSHVRTPAHLPTFDQQVITFNQPRLCQPLLLPGRSAENGFRGGEEEDDGQ